MSARRLSIFLLSPLLTVFFIYLSFARLIAPDEGYYIMAAKLVSQGKLLYRDFFYPQMPLLPYLYGIWMKVVGVSWVSARVFSALLTSLLAIVIFKDLEGKVSLPLTIIGTLLFATSYHVVAWHSLIQSYALAGLLLFGSYSVISSNYNYRYISSGLLLGLATDARAYLLLLLPVMLWEVWRQNRENGQFFTACMRYILGFAIATAPNLIFALQSWDNYWFNNLGYHLIRSDQPDDSVFNAKFRILQVLIGAHDSIKFGGAQFTMLLLGSIVYAAFMLMRRARVDLAFIIGIVTVLVSFIPTPTYVQYFSLSAPFFLVCTLLLAQQLIKRNAAGQSYLKLTAVIMGGAAFILIYLAPLKQNIIQYTQTGSGIYTIARGKKHHVPQPSSDATLAAISRIANAIDSQTNPDDYVMTFWPGYLVDSHANCFPGFENHFGLAIASKLDLEKREALKIFPREESIELITDSRLSLIAATDKEIRLYLMKRGNKKRPVVSMKVHGVNLIKPNYTH